MNVNCFFQYNMFTYSSIVLYQRQWCLLEARDRAPLEAELELTKAYLSKDERNCWFGCCCCCFWVFIQRLLTFFMFSSLNILPSRYTLFYILTMSFLWGWCSDIVSPLLGLSALCCISVSAWSTKCFRWADIHKSGFMLFFPFMLI